MKSSIQIKDNNIKIFIDGILHLSIKHDELIGFQSWILGDDEKIYCIEYYTKSKDILTEYNNFEKWKSILGLLDKNNSFVEKF